MEKLTEAFIQERLSDFFASTKYDVNGLYVFDWESDKLLWTKTGYIYEFEIKISRADYKNDFKHKAKKHIILNSVIESDKKEDTQLSLFGNLFEEKKKKYPSLTEEVFNKYWGDKEKIVDGQKMPNYFYYTTPKDMITVDEVPEYAGLIYVEGHTLSIQKKAPCLHKTIYSDGELNLGEKFYYNWMNTKYQLTRQKEKTDFLRKELKAEVESKGHEKAYEELERDLKNAEQKAESWRLEAVAKHKLYMTMVEGADYNTIERRLLLDELKKHGVDVQKRYSEIMKEADEKYKERYPNRK